MLQDAFRARSRCTPALAADGMIRRSAIAFGRAQDVTP